jgi:hypothetical protein
MSACPQCGTVAKPTDKFCNVCGTPVARASGAPAAPAGPPPYGAPAPPPFAAPAPGGYGGPPAQAFGPPPGAGPARCQMGHEIAPGASYCSQGHPIALDQMQFGNDAYGGGHAGYAPPPQQHGYGAPPPQGPPYGAPPPAPPFGGPPAGGFAPPPPQGGFGGPSAPPGFGPQQGQPVGFGSPPQPAPAFGPPPGAGFPPNNDTSRDAVPAKIVRGFLVAYGANPVGEFWPLTGGRLQVGRLGAVDGIEISLQDPTISSRHAAMVVDAQSGGVSVEDTGSTNGTFVNDEHIGFNGRRELRDGDRLRFGGFTTIVKVIGRL